MLQTEAATKAATSEKNSALRKAIFVSLRVAFGVAILIYLARSGRLDFSSLGRLQHEWRVDCSCRRILAAGYFFHVGARFVVVPECEALAFPDQFVPVESGRLSFLHVSAGRRGRRYRQGGVRDPRESGTTHRGDDGSDSGPGRRPFLARAFAAAIRSVFSGLIAFRSGFASRLGS